MVYISIYGDNPNNGSVYTEKTDAKYNDSGMYYKDGLASFSGLNHWLWDIIPYERNGNVSRDDFPGEDEKYYKNQDRYDYNVDAQQARNIFEKIWEGIKQ